jgi:hypothetical protein
MTTEWVALISGGAAVLGALVGFGGNLLVNRQTMAYNRARDELEYHRRQMQDRIQRMRAYLVLTSRNGPL